MNIKETDMTSYEHIKTKMAIGALIDVFDLISDGDETGDFELNCDIGDKYHIKITFEKSVK